MQNNNVTYFDSFGVEHIPKEIRAFIDRSLSITTNIFRIQAYDSTMCGYFFIGFIDLLLARKTLTKFTNLFSSNNFKKNWWYNFILWATFKNGWMQKIGINEVIKRNEIINNSLK